MNAVESGAKSLKMLVLRVSSRVGELLLKTARGRTEVAWLTRATVLLVAGTLLSVSSSVATQAGEANLSCYGESIDVDLVDAQGKPKVSLRLPTSLFPSIDASGSDGRDFDPLYTCVKEPVLARSIYLTVNHRARPEIGLSDPSLTIRRMEVRYGGGGRNFAAETRQDARIQGFLDAGGAELLSNGFIKLYPTPGPQGEFLGPKSTISPSGRRLYILCTPMVTETECSVRQSVESGLWLTYWFFYDEVDPDRWVALDGAVREAALSLFRP